MSVPGLACGGLFIGGDDAQITVTGSNTVTDTANANTYTFNNVSGLNSHTHVFLTVTIRGSAGGVTVSSLTVEGNAATFVVGLTTGFQRAEIWKITSGVATPDIVVNLSGTAANIKVGVVATNGADLANFATPTSSNADPAALSIATAAKGLVIVAGLNASGGTIAWTGVTEQSDSNLETSYTHTWGYSTTTTAESPRTVLGDWSGSNNNTAVCASFGPAATTVNPPRILDTYSNVTGAWSVSRQLKSSWASVNYTPDVGISQIADQSGNGNHLAQAAGGSQPSLQGTGPQSRAAARFDGANDVMSAGDILDLLSASNGYVICCAIVRAVTTNSGTLGNNDAIIEDGASLMGLYLKNNAGSYSFVVGNYDGSADSVAIGASIIDTVAVYEWRHEGGTLYGRLTLAGASPGAWSSTASGNTQFATPPSATAFGVGIGGEFTQVDVFEAVTFNAVPNDTLKDALVTNMLAHYG